MTTGLIGSIASAGSLTYTAQNPAKVLVAAANTTTTSVSVSVNGVPIISLAAVFSSGSASFYIGAGQSVTISNAAGMTSIVSVLEEY